MKRKILTYGGYFERFLESLAEKEQLKMMYVVSLLETPIKFHQTYKRWRL